MKSAADKRKGGETQRAPPVSSFIEDHSYAAHGDSPSLTHTQRKAELYITDRMPWKKWLGVML